MGRDTFLVRMALGRSPYEPVSESTQAPQPPADSPFQQQYDSKGHPINPETKRRTEAMIAAKNEILAAVGVCEKKNNRIDGKDEHGNEIAAKSRLKFTEDEWMAIRDAENDHGENIRMVAECSKNALTWWIIGLRRRLQVGLISSDSSFAELLSGEWASLTGHGFLGALRFLTVGSIPEVVAQLVLTFLDWFLGEQVLALSKKVLRLKASSSKRFFILRCVSFGYKSVNAMLHLLIYPMTSFSSLQHLGLISSSHLMAPRSWLLPWSPSSPLCWAFSQPPTTTPTPSRLKTILFSPASIWLAMTLIQHATAARHGPTPLCQHDRILGPHNKPSPQTPNPLSPFSTLRDKILNSLGWAPDSEPEDPRTHPPRDPTTRRQQSPPRSRVTDLTTLPSNLLALNIDSLLWTLLLLPSETAYLRALTSRFLAAPAARASVRAGALAGVSSPDLGSFGQRADKVGLCLAAQFVVDTAVWGAASVWSEWIGVERFYWGRV